MRSERDGTTPRSRPAGASERPIACLPKSGGGDGGSAYIHKTQIINNRRTLIFFEYIFHFYIIPGGLSEGWQARGWKGGGEGGEE